jgi:hypothetical protein
MEFDLSENAILVDLNVGQAGLTATSKTLTDEAASNHKADRASVRGIVSKLQREDLKPVTKAVNLAKAILDKNTLPFMSGSWRLCPLERYDALRTEMEEAEAMFADGVEELAGRQPELEKAYRKRLNDIAEEVKFPTADEIRGNFRLALSEMPLAKPNSVILRGLSDAMQDQIRARFEQDLDAKLQTATHDIIYRLIEMVDRVAKQTAKNEDTRWHESLVGNIRSVVPTLRGLNLTQNPEIDRLITRVEKGLSQVSVADLRDNEAYRKQTHQTASSILKELKSKVK